MGLTASRQSRKGTRVRAAPAGLETRLVAADLLAGVLDRHQSLDAQLTGASFGKLAPRDRALARAMVGVALRRLGEIDAVLDGLLDRRPGAAEVVRALQIGVAQILFMEVPDHAAVSLAVETVGRKRQLKGFRGLTNAVLRRVARERPAPEAKAGINQPDWLWTRWVAAYGPETAETIAAALTVEPYLDLTAKADPEAVADAVGGALLSTGSIRLDAGGPVEDLPGFDDGTWWVQDAAASLPARLLGPVAGRKIADLCAAPGGKTAQLAAAGAEVTAVDISADRLDRLAGNLRRLGLAAETVVADLLAWAPTERFDVVLLDAPCTATGTIRRHPDVAYLKREADIAALAKVQAAMIAKAADLLKPGGTLVYCTCSLEPEEGERQASVAREAGLTTWPLDASDLPELPEAITADGHLRTLPHFMALDRPRMSGLDGFFVMRMRRPA